MAFDMISAPRAGAVSTVFLSLLALPACATKPPTQTGFLTNQASMEKVSGTVRAQIERQRDLSALRAVQKLTLLPAKLQEGGDIPDTITPESRLLVLGELDRQLCFQLSRRFELVGPEDPSAARVQAVITRLQETSATASAASAAVSWFLPGGSVRLPVGRGGLSIEARLDLADGQQAAAMAWSRGAGVVMDEGSLSEVGDAHRFTANFADDFADFLVEPGTPKRALPAQDPCQKHGARLDLGRLAAGQVIGLHVPRPNSPTPQNN
ncbi:MAG: hypothetical protein CFE27_13695 [Alphaproteobacteria bacterium PA1]|nr:MAG: hypothetical protein CFE27_13695 [Alphaproteobacteria bacterium PA1]